MTPPPDAAFGESGFRPDAWRDRLLLLFFRRRWRGFFPLFRRLRPDNTLHGRARYGASFRLTPLEYIDTIVLNEGYYESEVMEALRPFFAPGRVLWDIGANFGLHALSAARLAPGLEICAFEPNPATFDRLAGHVRLNGAGIRALPFALGDATGEAGLWPGHHGNSGAAHLLPAAATTTLRVPVRRADELVQSGAAPAPDLVKLDVEGHELPVLHGFGPLLDRPSLRAVVYEATPDSPVTHLLAAHGFAIRELTRREATGHALGNFLASRP